MNFIIILFYVNINPCLFCTGLVGGWTLLLVNRTAFLFIDRTALLFVHCGTLGSRPGSCNIIVLKKGYGYFYVTQLQFFRTVNLLYCTVVRFLWYTGGQSGSCNINVLVLRFYRYFYGKLLHFYCTIVLIIYCTALLFVHWCTVVQNVHFYSFKGT